MGARRTAQTREIEPCTRRGAGRRDICHILRAATEESSAGTGLVRGGRSAGEGRAAHESRVCGRVVRGLVSRGRVRDGVGYLGGEERGGRAGGGVVWG